MMQSTRTLPQTASTDIGASQQRVLRTHVNWLDFMSRAVTSYRRWVPLDDAERERLRADAQGLWYGP